MINKGFTLFISFWIPFQAIAQINDLPILPTCQPIDVLVPLAKDSNEVNQFRNRLLPYKTLEQIGTKFIRRDFDNQGRLIKEGVITKEAGVDTTTFFDANLNKDVVKLVQKDHEFPNGFFTEYRYFGDERKVKHKGAYRMYKPVGRWEYYDKAGNKTIVTYNQEGELSGPYQEFYYNLKKGSYILKIDGAFAIRTYSFKRQTKFGKSIKYNQKEVRRTGSWSYFAPDGTLLETLEYNWLLKQE